MKLFNWLFIGLLAIGMISCSDELDVQNPNEPTLDVLEGEEGIQRLMLGMYNVEDGGYVWIAQAHHECMGDAIFIPWGNFGWRWANQPTNITLDDGSVWTPPQGTDQGSMLVSFNDRAQGDNNAFGWEWAYMYRFLNVANLLLERVGTTDFVNGAETKSATVKGFANFWKGFVYSRIGSLYSAGIITDVPGESNPNYVNNDAMIVEANRVLDLAIAEFNAVSDEAIYTQLMSGGIPDFMRPNGVPTAQQMVRLCNTLKARNILVNTKLRDMTAADWNQIASLTANGLQQGDVTLEWRTASENSNFFTGFVPYRVLIGWHFVSPRLIQDFKEGDARYERNFDSIAVSANIRGRGIQYGNEHDFVSIEEGGDIAALEQGLASLPVGGDWTENSLMRAEALIMTGDIEGGLALIDAVRIAQNANLAAVEGTGLDMNQAYEELRRERRIGLLLKGLAFYDARRWGVTEPVSEGGGRTGAVVYDASGVKNVNCTINYNYLDYWGVPDDELDFNLPADGSASVEPR